MPRTTGVDILSIRPDSDLGVAQGVSTPVPVVAPLVLDQVNKANQDIRMYDHQRQLMKYDHELKQQAKLLEGLANDEVAVGAIEPDDQAEFNRLEREVDQLFLAVKSNEPDKDGQNKPLKAYKSKLQDLKDYTAAAQAKHVQLNKLRQVGSSIDPDDDAKVGFDEFFTKQQKKYPGQIIDPYVPPVYADFEALKEYQKGALLEGGKPINVPATTTTNKVTVGPKGTTAQTTTTEKPVAGAKAGTKGQPIAGEVGANGLLPVEYTEPDKEWSFDEIYRKANFDAATPKGMKNQRRVWETFMGNPDLLPKKQLEEWNKQLAKYHNQKGIESIKVPGSSAMVKDPITGEQSIEPGAEVDTGEFPYQINYEVGKDGKIIMRDDPVALAAKISLANVDGDYVVKGRKIRDENAIKLNQDAAKLKFQEAESKARINAINALASQRRASANLTNQKSKAVDNQYNPAQTFGELFKGKMTTSQGSALPSVNMKDMSKSFVDNLGIDPATDDGDFKIVPVNVKFKGTPIPEDEVQKMYIGWLSSPSGKDLESQIGKTPDIFDFLFAKGAEFGQPEILGRVKPIYAKNPTVVDGKIVPVLLNPNEAGKPTRSNALQSWINQRGQMKVTGSKLMMEDDNSNDNNIDQ